jgi:hypothetical protein
MRVRPAWTPAGDSVAPCRAYNHRRWEFEKDVLGIDERAPFLCECNDPDCCRVLSLTMLEYESAHLHDGWCVVVPEHVPRTGSGRLVLTHPHFCVVEPISLGTALAVVRHAS